MLIVFSGPPGTGKSTLARQLAESLAAIYLRIDRVEQEILASSLDVETVEEAGYLAAYELAEDNLRLGLTVITDAVNPIALARDAWIGIADRIGCRCMEIEVICSDLAEHRRRVETRAADINGHKLPTWQQVLDRDYQPWTRDRQVFDTAGKSVAECLELLQSQLPAEVR